MSPPPLEASFVLKICRVACLMSSSPLKQRFAGRLNVHCDLLMLTFTPSVPKQFVIPHVEDGGES